MILYATKLSEPNFSARLGSLLILDGVDDGRIDDDVEGSEFIQQLAKVLLTLFWRGIVDVWTEDVWKVYFFYC